jgi:hypothetical protein
MATKAAAERKQNERQALIKRMLDELGDLTPEDQDYVQVSLVS